LWKTLILQFYSIKIGVDNLVESKVDIFFSTYYGIVFEKRGERKNMNLSKLSTIWEQVLQIVKDQLQDNKVYETFFQNSKLYKVDGDTAYICVQKRGEASLFSFKAISVEIGDIVALYIHLLHLLGGAYRADKE